MALSKIFFVLALTAVAEAMACNPRKDATCCSTPRAPPPRPPTGTTPPPTLCARARAEDTNKCKMWYPERCASNSFVKKCRASCHARYPLMEYCKPSLEAKFAQLEERLNKLALTPCKDGKDGASSEEVCEGHGYNKEQCPTNTGCCCYGEICENAGISTADEMCRSAAPAYAGRPSTWPCENYRGE